MAIDPLSASRIYQAAARQAALAKPGPEEAGPVDFQGLVQGAVADAATAARTAEKAGLQVAAGRADIVDVVTAVAAAETTLETVIAVRDQVIQAYQEILRMPI
jgi:flagellar hook-basal body complex protein FliE